MSRNREVAQALYEIAEILELQGVDFKPRAYERAAQNIEAFGEDVATLAKENRLGDVPGVGKAISQKVHEFLDHGEIEYLEKLRKEVPAGMLEIMKLPNMGPKKAQKLYAELRIDSVAELKAAAEAGKVRQIKGFGAKSEQQILEGIERKASLPDKFPQGDAMDAAREILAALDESGHVERAEYAGSLRRGKDYVGDVDLLAIAAGDAADKAMDVLIDYRRVEEVLAHGGTKSSVRLDNGLQVDLRVLEAEHYGAALMYFTGSKEHNVALRARAQTKGWTLNEYALRQVDTEDVVASKTEEGIYKKLGLQYIAPELRENRGEIEKAANRDIPDLVTVDDLTADLHTHTVESDGYGKPAEMLAEAQKLGYTLYGISDHSQGLGVASGLDGKRFKKQRKQIDALRDDFPDLTILQGSEVNIKKSGDLDLTPKVRAELDYVIGSVHSSFTLDPKEQTDRILKSIETGIDILGHPTGRLVGQRPAIEYDFETVAQACRDADVLLEIDASPFRLDLNGDLIRAAKEIGCRFTIDSDAHTVAGLHAMHYGVTQARRGWLTAEDVVSTRKPEDIQKFLGHAKKG